MRQPFTVTRHKSMRGVFLSVSINAVKHITTSSLPVSPVRVLLLMRQLSISASEDQDVYAEFNGNEDVEVIREEHKADFVQLFHPLDDYCGMG